MDNDSTSFYGVYIPNEVTFDKASNVFTDKISALKVIKEQKKARFKVFKTREEAENFAINGAEQIHNEIPTTPTAPSNPRPPNNGESKFRGPSSQALVLFRKLIENGDLLKVKQTVWDNPRYLISSGDTPSILKEGQRYNALHIAAIGKDAKMCELILDTISDLKFMMLFYGDSDLEMCEERGNKLLDLYLNTPDKGLNETPLHFAVKFGAVECVELLAAYPGCDKNLRNKFGQLPKEMICLRIGDSTPGLVNRIAKALAPLEEQFYVPVVRSNDDSIVPEVGIPFNANSPPILNGDPMSPCVNVFAVAGPMEQSAAHSFRKKWKTPPRLINSPRTKLPEAPPFFKNVMSTHSLRKILNDPEKGLERIGRELAHQYEIGWKEYWPFLNTFTDLNSTEGLDLLEKHIERKYQFALKTWEEQNKTIAFGKILAGPQYIITGNYENNNISKSPVKSPTQIVSPMSDLCKVFENSCII